jgi:hypothetical protein
LRKEGITDDSVVTVGILREAFEEFATQFETRIETWFEARLEAFGTRLETRLEARLEEKLEAKFHHYIGVVMENNRHDILLIIEHSNMRFETIDRYMKGNEEDKEKINYRLNRLESKVLLA